MIWERSDRFEPRAVKLADDHYSRQKPGTPQFMRPGSCLVLYAGSAPRDAVWGTSWQLYAKHPWAGAWECAIFRNRGAGRSSRLIRDAVAATRFHYGAPPELGMITYVDPAKVREKVDPGHSFIIAGFRPIACMLPTRDHPKGLLVLQMRPDRMPEPRPAIGTQLSLERNAA